MDSYLQRISCASRAKEKLVCHTLRTCGRVFFFFSYPRVIRKPGEVR